MSPPGTRRDRRAGGGLDKTLSTTTDDESISSNDSTASDVGVVVAIGEPASVPWTLAELREHEQGVERGFREAGRHLEVIRDHKLYQLAGSATFTDYLRCRWGVSIAHAQRLIAATQTVEVLESSPTGDEIRPVRESQVGSLTTLRDKPEKLQAAWAAAVTDAGGTQPTAKQVAAAVEVVTAKRPHVDTTASHKRSVLTDADSMTVGGVEIRCGDAREHRLGDIADLAFFSPQYNVGIDYDGDESNDCMTDREWRKLLAGVVDSCRRDWRVGRIVVNLPAARNRKPYEPLVLPSFASLELEAVIVWDKGPAVVTGRTTWGSFRQPTNPKIRDRTERLYVLRTEHPLRGAKETLVTDAKSGKRVSPLMSSADFTELTQDLWVVPPESARVGHPAPFPIELARRVIRLYGWPGCRVLDPFGGSGTTGVAALELGCEAVLIDRSAEYCKLAFDRLKRAAQ